MSTNIKLYKKLFSEKKFNEIIEKIEELEKDKSAQVLHILGICKVLNNGKDKNIKLSAREDFRKAFLKEKNTNLGIEALSNFINLSTDLLKTKDSLKYFDEVKKDFGDNLQLLKAISRVYQFNVRAKDRNKILKDIVRLSPSSINDWCSYIYINNFFRDWDQKQYYSYSKELSNNIKNFNLEKISLDRSIKNRKIKIAFLSSDIYRGHSVTYFILGLLKNINRNKFKMFAISNSKIGDEENNELKGQFDDWYNIKQLNDIDAIKFVREKNFDIVFDIMGFTSENRITLFKNRIAPIQISWLGYCNTTGLDEMDYILSDKNLIFQDEENFYSEKVKNFKEIWNVHCGFEIERKKVELPFLKKEIFTFGSFNNFNKISDSTLESWSIILSNIKNSRLILKSSVPYDLENFINRIDKLNILDKVKILDRSPNFISHLNKYNEIDLALDTFPYNGVTTTFEALWKGIPVLTMDGYNFNSRCGSSIIKNLGIDYLIAKNEKDYVSKATYLATDKKKLKEIRDNIFDNVLEKSLFDTNKFAKNFEILMEEIISEKLLLK
mgnify:CR=1 FL=1